MLTEGGELGANDEEVIKIVDDACMTLINEDPIQQVSYNVEDFWGGNTARMGEFRRHRRCPAIGNRAGACLEGELGVSCMPP